MYVKKNLTQYIVVHGYGIIGRIIEANAISHIVKSIKNQKGKPSEISLPLLKNDITGSEPTVKILDT